MVTEIFEKFAKDIWQDIPMASKLELLYGEETITDIRLLELAKQNFSSIKIIQTPKAKEALYGTDWEWYVGSNKHGWIRYLIQAKKLNPKTFRYDSLKHLVGKPPRQFEQHKLLRAYAKQTLLRGAGAIPLYNFFNHFPNPSPKLHWHCSKPFSQEQFGWSFTPLNVVEQAIFTHGWRNFDKIHQKKSTFPIRCLFSCFKKYLENLKADETIHTFLGEPFHKLATLPKFLDTAKDTGFIDVIPQQVYLDNILILPKYIAIIDISQELIDEN